MAQRVSVEDWPRLTRFYGIGPSELAKIPHALLRLYAEQLVVLASEEALLGFTTADMPHMKESDRDRIKRQFARHLPEPEAEPVDVRTEEGAGVVAGLGIGVHIEGPEVESSVEG